jgi:uncharacterized protein
MPESAIVDNAALHRFELHQDGEIAFLLYQRSKNSLRLIHTEVPDALRGKGVGSKLVSDVLRLAENSHLTVIPSCPFVADYLKGHPEYVSIVDPEYRWMLGQANQLPPTQRSPASSRD